MLQTLQNRQTVLRELGGGLIVRCATPADTGALVALYARVFPDENNQPDPLNEHWVRDLMSGAHPTFRPGDFTVVEDPRTGTIASALCLISQRWSYGGVEFGVGQPELVGTLPEYRRRGLVRAQFEVVHQWSAERGEKVQVIGGIPWYYRQFGYDMALWLGGGRFGYASQGLPKLKEGESEPFTLRPAIEADAPQLMQYYAQSASRSLVSCVRDEALWRYDLAGHSAQSDQRREFLIITSAGGEPVGFLAHLPLLGREALIVTHFEVKPGVSWMSVIPTVLRYLHATGSAYAARDRKPFAAFRFGLGVEHPVYDLIPDRLPLVRQPYAWYVRVPDLPDFIRHIRSVLEQRLAGSYLAGHSGELKLNFYRDGLRFVWERGRLANVERWLSALTEDGSAGFPNLTFLQLLFGYRTLEEMRHAYADCWHKDEETRALLKALFPKQPSNVWMVG
ncbi:MAG: GNAT family N-acetyltransferase [Chloroflexi bacterium]|nr:GNAT family N-acetyltransferase [Chloroflexota bacterium]